MKVLINQLETDIAKAKSSQHEEELRSRKVDALKGSTFEFFYSAAAQTLSSDDAKALGKLLDKMQVSVRDDQVRRGAVPLTPLARDTASSVMSSRVAMDVSLQRQKRPPPASPASPVTVADHDPYLSASPSVVRPGRPASVGRSPATKEQTVSGFFSGPVPGLRHMVRGKKSINEAVNRSRSLGSLSIVRSVSTVVSDHACSPSRSPRRAIDQANGVSLSAIPAFPQPDESVTIANSAPSTLAPAPSDGNMYMYIYPPAPLWGHQAVRRPLN